MSLKVITHSGRVVGVESRAVNVVVEVDEACGSCAARSACSLGTNSESRIVRVDVPSTHSFKVGDDVEVAIRRTSGLVAVLLCYVVPLVVLVAILVLSMSFGAGEGLAALLSLSALALYYVGLAFMHRHISKKIIFTIKNRE